MIYFDNAATTYPKPECVYTCNLYTSDPADEPPSVYDAGETGVMTEIHRLHVAL